MSSIKKESCEGEYGKVRTMSMQVCRLQVICLVEW